MPKLKSTPGMQDSGMPTNPNRGRPPITDTSQLKTSTMTICLTPDVHNQLRELATNQNQKPAAMGRILIEAGIDKGTSMMDKHKIISLRDGMPPTPQSTSIKGKQFSKVCECGCKVSIRMTTAKGSTLVCKKCGKVLD